MNFHVRVFTIGELAKETATTTPTIRYYEEIGLLPPASRKPGGQRIYDESTLLLLTFIRRCRDFGFSIDEVESPCRAFPQWQPGLCQGPRRRSGSSRRGAQEGP